MSKKRVLGSISISLVICMVLTFVMPAYASAAQKNRMQIHVKFGKQVNFVIKQGIFKGDGRGNYALQDYVKRGDVMVMIVRSFMLSAILGPNFPDVDKNSYYYNAIATAKSMGIAKGDGKRFHPQKYVTIKEAIALIERSAAVANANVNIDTSVDLNDLYSESDLSRYATREDVADMLYYILTGDTTEDDNEDNYDLDQILYTGNEDKIINFQADDFLDVFENGDEDLSYVKFTLPSSTYGKLYYDYESADNYDALVSATAKYYADPDEGLDLDKVAFVPRNDYSGSVTIAYTAYDEDDESYTGSIKLTIKGTNTELAAIKYTANENSSINFDDEDFIDVFEDASDEELSYVKFTLPSSTYGKLYYDYVSASNYDALVSATTKYYADPDEGLDLDKVAFVPREDYSGSVTIAYTAYDDDGDSYAGSIKIAVEEKDTKLAVIEYKTTENSSIKVDDEDFIDVFDDANDEALSYVKFTLPSSTYGKLYYNYVSTNNYDALVSTTTKYYADPDDGLDLDKVAFVPREDYNGSVTIAYTAYDADGDSYTGSIKIAVAERDTTLATIQYTTSENSVIRFKNASFIDVLDDVSDEDLSYVKFTIPVSNYGRLYYDYQSSSDYGALVTEGTKYYADPAEGVDLEKVAFVPYSDYTGTIFIKYVAYDEDGYSYSGTIKIVVQ